MGKYNEIEYTQYEEEAIKALQVEHEWLSCLSDGDIEKGFTTW